MNRFGVSVLRLLLRSVILSAFCNEHVRVFFSFLKNTDKKTRKIREFCARIFCLSIEMRLKIRARVYVCVCVLRVHFQL